MPDPSRLNLNGPGRQPGVVPYPTGRQGLGTQDPNYRPSSAFGINPNLRPISAATVPNPRPQGSEPPYPSPGAQLRPHSTVDSGIQGYGRGDRVPSGQLPPHGPGFAPQGRLGPRPGSASPHVQSYPSGQATPPPQRLDIGYAAPFEPERKPDRKPERKPNQQRPNDHYSAKPIPPLPSQQRVSARTNIPAQQGPPPRDDRYATGRLNERPQTGANRPPDPGRSPNSVPGRTPAGPPVPTAAPAKPNVVSATTAATRPPGKGPKTFEEMGVPQGKSDSECVSRCVLCLVHVLIAQVVM